jgi:hypothetical protein
MKFFDSFLQSPNIEIVDLRPLIAGLSGTKDEKRIARGYLRRNEKDIATQLRVLPE